MIIICENRSAVYKLYVLRTRQDLVTIICNATAYLEAHQTDDAFGLAGEFRHNTRGNDNQFPYSFSDSKSH